MKKIFLFIGNLIGLCVHAQQGKVGINTDAPSATLDIVSKANTAATKALKISNSSSSEMVTIRDNGQVGINQATPATDALLELNAANKALLLTRISNVTDVATPVNGMLVYDITQKCIRGYENNAWSGCFSSGGGGSVTTPPTVGTERTPCAGLTDIRDLNLSNNSFRSYGGVPMFISNDGFIYGGWSGDNYGFTGLGATYTGDISNTYNYSGSNLYSAYPAANILKNLPNARWKRIIGNSGSGYNMFGITEDGKMYVWGGTANSASWPTSGTLTTFTKRTQLETPREIVNPAGNQWKEFYCTSEYMYAVDHTGKWWSWGGRTTAVYNAISFAYSPTATQPYYLTPNPAAALVPAPKYDPNMEETFAALQGNGAVSFVYIGTDNKVYTFGENVGANNGALISPPQQITLPAGVNAAKILPGFTMANFLILGDNGVVYRVGNGQGYIPATTYTAVLVNTLGNLFKDIIIGYNSLSIIGVPKNGGDMVKLTYSWNASGLTTPTSTTIPVGSRFNPVKMWSDVQENIIIKDGTTGNLFAYNDYSQFTSNSWVALAAGVAMTGTTGSNVDSNGISLTFHGPFKLINCQQ